jgi:hypothetical protein
MSLSRWKTRCRHFNEFDGTGIFQMRRNVAGQIYYETPGKNEDAVLWVHRYDHWYPRMAVVISVFALLVSMVGAIWTIFFRARCP